MNENQRWYYAVDDQTHGPLDALELERLIQHGVVFPSTWIVAEGTEDWSLAEDSVFADKFVSPPSGERTPAVLECVGVEHRDVGSHRKSGAPDTARTTAEMLSAQIRGLVPIVRRHWRVLVPGLLVLAGVVLLLHQFRHWHHPRRDRASAPIEGVSEPTHAPVQTVTASTPRPRLDIDTLRKQYATLTGIEQEQQTHSQWEKDMVRVTNQEKQRRFSDWEDSMRASPSAGTLDTTQWWKKFQTAVFEYESFVPFSTFSIVQQLDNHTYEARFDGGEYTPPTSFVLLTRVTSFESTGRASLPIAFVKSTTMKLHNGFNRQYDVYSEVVQGDAEQSRQRLNSTALSLSSILRAAPPDDTTLEGYIADIYEHNARHFEGERTARTSHMYAGFWEDMVLYVCLQTRLRNEFQPVSQAEAKTPSASATPSPSNTRRQSRSRNEAPRPSASPSPSVLLDTPRSVGDTRPSPSPRLAKPGIYFLLQYASVKTDRGVYGIEPGHEVHLVREVSDKGTVIVSDGKLELETLPSLLTNDLDVAAQLARADAATQAQIVSRLQTEKSAAEARQHELDVARSRDVEAAEKQRLQNSRARATPNPLDP